MNKIIIIGNGFDLAHGLKTDYSSFIKWYVKKSIISGFKGEKLATDLLRFNISDVSTNVLTQNFHINYSSISSLDPIECWFLGLSKYDGNLSFNFKLDDKVYMLSIKIESSFLRTLFQHQSTLNWVDIEMLYYKALKVNLNKFNSLQGQQLNAIKHLHCLNSDFEIIKNELELYLHEISNSVIINKSFIDKAENSINKLHILNEYFLSEEGGFKSEDYEEGSERYIIPKIITFLSFNYTGLLNGLNKQNKFKVINIHGQLMYKSNPIIFGYGDEMDEDYLEMEKTNERDFLTNIKSFGYFNNSNYSNLVQAIDSEPFVVEIWGHSCGLSDRTLLNMIFEHDNCVYISPNYWKKSDTEDDYVKLTQDISRHFNDKKKMRNRVLNKNLCIPL